MRVKHKVNVIISRDSAGKNVLFGFDDALAEVIQDGAYDGQSGGLLSIAALASEDVPFRDVTAVKGVFLRVHTGAPELRLNGAATGIQLQRAVATDPITFFVEADVSQVELVAGAEAVTASYCVWGDPVV